ncbi:T-cell surface glycoprotein CD8 alpha chain [Brienomyrus brachyistius]|uniref:T-cell surface glycoprotein CD8 alpha chain n=1 Tax=Brienomyrus brachyistius TaxID=42636 RepID=UPI0020B3356E|nr:T-cell surface glycoprotein CD8 alpha chain [Brienomyrus brachyistius]
MYQILISLLILFNCTCLAEVYKEGDDVKITCKMSPPGTIVFWFRVLQTGIEAIGSFNIEGEPKMSPNNSMFDYSSIRRHNTITLKGFQKNRDSGTYSCGKLNGNKLSFGELTVIKGLPESPPAVKPVTAQVTPGSTTQPCPCRTPSQTKSKSSEGCPMVIWVPLTAACSLIFLILILIICHCNRIRTRRCPHHYKRKPKNVTPARQAMGERYH